MGSSLESPTTNVANSPSSSRLNTLTGNRLISSPATVLIVERISASNDGRIYFIAPVSPPPTAIKASDRSTAVAKTSPAISPNFAKDCFAASALPSFSPSAIRKIS